MLHYSKLIYPSDYRWILRKINEKYAIFRKKIGNRIDQSNRFIWQQSMHQDLPWVDSHCHLEMLKDDIDSVLAKSREMSVNQVITIGTDETSNQQVNTLTKTHTEVFGTVGCHPHNASAFTETHRGWMKDQLIHNLKLLGIGECGFDFFYGFLEEEDQRRTFIRQFELAIELDLPLVIHTREAEKQTIEVLDQFQANLPAGVFHCFTSSLDLARYVLDRGYYISFNGICTFPKSENVRAILQYTPLDRMLLETDSPYLSPVPFRGKPNFPGNVSIIGEYISDFLKIPATELASITHQNLNNLFPRLSYED